MEGVADEHREVYERNYQAHVTGCGQADVLGAYDKWAPTYEKEMIPGLYNGPDIVVEAVQRYLPHSRDTVLMDMAAGTGIVGKKLHAAGYPVIDANEPSEGMRNMIGSAGETTYRTVHPYFLDANQTAIPGGEYDAVVVSGGFGEGHIPTAALNELARLTRKGGFVIIVMREEYLAYVDEYKDRLEPAMTALAEQGTWTRLERTVVPKYSFNKNGVLFVFKKLTAD